MKHLLFFIFSLALGFNLHSQNFEVPKTLKLDQPEDYATYEKDVLNGIKWLKDTPLNEQKAKRKEVSAFLITWISGAPNVSVLVDLKVCPYASNADCFLMFMAGWTEYALTNKDNSKTEGAYAGTRAVLDFYTKNKDELGKVKGIKKLLKKRKKKKLKAHISDLMKNH